MKESRQKLKMFYLMKILLEQSDEEHPLTVPDMIEALEKLHISAERKSVYDDIENLKQFGLDICSRKGKSLYYFIGSREFELPELKLLVDSVQSSKFITHKKSMELISKIEKLTSVGNAGKLQRQVFVTNRVKNPNEQIYYNVDKIYDAIGDNRMIRFHYFEWNTDKEKQYRKGGNYYTESPMALAWEEDNYYLITYKKKYDHFVHYRVDKMENIEICNEPRVMPRGEFDLASYMKSVFSMYGGEETDVSVKFTNDLIGVVIDRFGTDVVTVKTDENHFTCNLKIAVSPLFLSWIISFGNKAEITGPESVRKQIRKLLKESAEQYTKKPVKKGKKHTKEGE